MGPVRLLSGASLPCRIPSPRVWAVPGEPLTKQKMAKVTALGPLVLLPGGLGQGISGRKWGQQRGERGTSPHSGQHHWASYLPRSQLPPGPPTPGAGSLLRVLDAGLCRAVQPLGGEWLLRGCFLLCLIILVMPSCRLQVSLLRSPESSQLHPNN